jgi:hypothetical protein
MRSTVQEDKSPATKQDLAELRTELITHIDQRSDHLIEQMREMQTEVLRAIHNSTSPVDVKLRGHEERGSAH